MKRTFVKKQHGLTFNAIAYSEDEGKTWRWEANGHYCPLDACEEYQIPCNIQAQQQAIDHQIDEFVKSYRERMKDYQPTPEEQYEMEAAFGPDCTVVDIITGQQFRT